jgi:hypothetical protein
MNQRGDSWKKNLQLMEDKTLVYLDGGLLSHTMRRTRVENSIKKAFATHR